MKVNYLHLLWSSFKTDDTEDFWRKILKESEGKETLINPAVADDFSECFTLRV